MKVLVLGGTGYLGPEVVQSLVAAGHTVTLFNRGRTNKDLFPDLEKLVGDRNGDLAALKGRRWDVVVDVHASQPKWVQATCDLLQKSCKVYVFVSTVSVYNDFSSPGITEAGPMFEDDQSLDTVDRVTNENYGPMKVRSESIVRTRFPGANTIVRPGLIVGPTDPTDRFTWWPVRVDQGGEVLAPGDGKDAVQFIDVRDLGAFIAKLVTDGHAGTFNATGPAGELSMAEFLYGCKAATGNKVSFVWADAGWLLEQGVAPFADVPMWAPGAEMIGFMRIDCSKAQDVGLTHRPLAQTAMDTIAWAKTRPDTYKWQAGWSADKEAAVLAKWKAKH
jgi:2'-hydroxyisoflavone reductase